MLQMILCYEWRMKKLAYNSTLKKTKIMASGPHYCMANRWGKSGKSGRFYFLYLQNHCGWWLQPWNFLEKKLSSSWKKSYDKPRQHIKKQRHHFATKVHKVKAMFLFSSYVWMWELDHKKAECQRIGAFELWCWRWLLRVSWTARRSK